MLVVEASDAGQTENWVHTLSQVDKPHLNLALFKQTQAPLWHLHDQKFAILLPHSLGNYHILQMHSLITKPSYILSLATKSRNVGIKSPMKWNASCCIVAQVLLLSVMHCFQKIMKMVTGRNSLFVNNYCFHRQSIK